MIRVSFPATIVGLDESGYDFNDRSTGERVVGTTRRVSLSIGGGTPNIVKVRDDAQWLEFRHIGFLGECEAVFAFEPVKGQEGLYRLEVEQVRAREATDGAKSPAAATNGGKSS